MSKPDKLTIKEVRDHYTTYLANMVMFPGLYRELAEDLGVSEESLRALGVGYWPCDNKGRDWWIFPERNHKGIVVGLMRRPIQPGKKLAVEGSTRGLSYMYNENARAGHEKFAPGYCTWVRLCDAGVECPICKKPDYCMVSSDYKDSEGPSAVCCTRVKEGASFELEYGNIHILDSIRQAKSGSGVLPETDQPILIVEGPTDVCAAFDLGFVAVGKPGATSGMKLLKEMPLAGKTIWNMGENDAGIGQIGMEKAYCCLSSLSKSVTCIMPPAGTKDLRQWIEHGVTAVSLAEYVRDRGILNPVDESRIIRGDVSYVRLAEQFIASFDNRLIFHHKDWWQYGGGRYQLIEEGDVGADISTWACGFKTVSHTGIVADLKIDIKLGREVTTAVRNLVRSRVPGSVAEPFIISTGEPVDMKSIIMFKNGLLNIVTDAFTSHSDDLFTTATLPYDYAPNATCPDWDVAMPQWFADDVDKGLLLQEWFGWNLLATNYLEQVMFMCGQSGSGKGTAVQTMTHMLGGNFGVIDTLSITKDVHALASLAGKYACLINEEGKLSSGKSQKVLSIIKAISGNDPMLMRGMNKIGVPGRLFCRITYSSNELPVFTDEMQTLFRRLNLLEFKIDFRDRPDTGLKIRLEDQIPGIANWAIVGLKRLLANRGKFTQPESSKAEIEEIKLEASPLKDALTTYLTFDDPKAFLSRRLLFDFYTELCKKNEVRNLLRFGSFRRRCKEAMPELDKRNHKSPEGLWGYWGVFLNEEANELLP